MEFNKNKLEVNFIYPMTKTYTLQNRKYTLTHSDDTGILYLDIANFYNYKKIDIHLRDEVLGNWVLVQKNKYNLLLNIYLKGYYTYEIKRKYEIFKSHLNMAIKSILYGDRDFLIKNNFLLNSNIIVNFSSSYFMYNSSEYYGLVKDYLI
ncbi:staygreen family protein [Paraclostridium ghonii]|uniref:staygreen family protein n=1 Tax=Paraclostridium ghonii TaxID=29358 RepID=UPI00202CC342|nr:staygreen family protein [Paeniclostridium ghonii]MCM0168183.1 staygreen family protein [Paeniclostridium ghonii]